MRSYVNFSKVFLVSGCTALTLAYCSQSGSKKSSGGGTPAPTTPEVIPAKTTPPASPTPPGAACLTENAPSPDAPSSSTCTGTPQPPSPAPTAPSGGTADATADAGPGYEACDKLGQAWIPSTSTETKGQCGPKLVSWCCNETEIYTRFGQYAADQLKAKFKANTDQGLLLYHCGVDGNKYTFYFFKGDSQGIKTGQVWMTQTNVKQDASAAPCKKLTAQELGADRI